MVFELQAETREGFGKAKCKALREAGRLPAVIYGGDIKDNVHITLDLHSAERTMKENGRKASYTIIVGGKSYPVRIGEVRREPIRKGFLHVDFIATQEKAG